MSKHLHSVFCDDIRLEAGNKLSYMGVYNGTMVVPAFPYDMPRLSVVTRVVFDQEEPLSSSFRMVLLLNDQEIGVLEAPAEESSPPFRPLPEINGATDIRQQRSAQVIFTLPPLRIEAPSILRTRAIFANETLRGGGLMIITQPG